MTASAFAAVDLGATSGRVVRGTVEPDRLELETVHRFPTPTETVEGSLTWVIDDVLAEVRAGLVAAAARGPLTSVGVDSWAIDYALYDDAGQRLGPVHAYRSARTAGVMDSVTEAIGRRRIYEATGIQFLPFNTVYQLVAARATADYAAAARMLMVADVVNHDLCGSTTNDVTNASTTQLLDVRRRAWSGELVEALGLRGELLPALHDPGTVLGPVAGVHPSLDGTPVVAVASHDTASAVVGTPMSPGRPAIYISCGTWSLVGCELAAPVTTPAALAANVTNELGAGATYRVLRNVTGLWLFEECRRSWAAAGLDLGAEELMTAAGAQPGGRCVIDPDDTRFAAPGDMPARIVAACAASGQPEPSTPAEVTRVIVDSMALAWRRTVAAIGRVAGVDAEVVHLVGGGSAIGLLRRLCASACDRPVLAGPVEATVAGNVIVQAVAAGVLPSIEAGRALVATAPDVVRSEPEPTLDWPALERRLPRPDDGSG